MHPVVPLMDIKGRSRETYIKLTVLALLGAHTVRGRIIQACAKFGLSSTCAPGRMPLATSGSSFELDRRTWMWQILCFDSEAFWPALARGEPQIVITQDVSHDRLDLLGSKEAARTCVPSVPKTILYQLGVE